MQVRRWLRCAVVCLLCGTALIAPSQKNRREPLTEAQQDQLAEAGIVPYARIGLYTKFVSEHVSRLEAIGKRSESGRGQRRRVWMNGKRPRQNCAARRSGCWRVAL